MRDLGTLYQTEYSAWAPRHAELLRAGGYAELDIEHLLEEVSNMSKSERRELESRLMILLAHLLKWEYQYRNLSARWREFDGRRWRSTIVEQCKQLAVLLRQSTGLKSVLGEAITAAYPDAVDRGKSGLDAGEAKAYPSLDVIQPGVDATKHPGGQVFDVVSHGYRPCIYCHGAILSPVLAACKDLKKGLARWKKAHSTMPGHLHLVPGAAPIGPANQT